MILAVSCGPDLFIDVPIARLTVRAPIIIARCVLQSAHTVRVSSSDNNTNDAGRTSVEPSLPSLLSESRLYSNFC